MDPGALAAGLPPAAQEHTRARSRWHPKPWWQARSRIVKGGISAAADAEIEAGYGASMAGLTRVWAHRRLKNMLIFLDDLERRGQDLLVLDVLGLISDAGRDAPMLHAPHLQRRFAR